MKKVKRKAKMYEFHLFAGGGGGIYGGLLLGHTPVGAVEIEKYQQKVLLARQADGTFPKFPIWDDVRTFTKHNNNCRQFIKQLRHVRNNLCIAGGFPCQDISVAGKGAGLDGERSGLWAEYFRIICEIRPRYAFIENSPMLVIRGLDRVLCDLAKIGYNATWCVMGADDVKAPHRRKRIWILANARCRSRRGKQTRSENTSDVLSDTLCERGTEIQFQAREFQGARPQHRELDGANCLRYASWWDIDPADLPNATKSELGRVAYGVANRSKRLETIGNGQVPAVAATAFRILHERLEKCQ